jgi:hypothetical protein
VFCERVYQMDVDTRDWSCVFRIEWPHRPEMKRKIFGIDSVQALELAMRHAAVELYTAEPAVYRWEPDDILGLPLSKPFAYLEAARSKGRG